MSNILGVLISLALTFSAMPAAQAGSYNFTQTGWTPFFGSTNWGQFGDVLPGDMVSGSFSGVDSNGDGVLSSTAGEITGFTMNYSVLSGTGARMNVFSLGFTDLTGLSYQIGNSASFGVVASAPGMGAYLGGVPAIPPSQGMAMRDGLMMVSVAPVQIAAVAEPETYALMLAGLGLVGFMARRHKTI